MGSPVNARLAGHYRPLYPLCTQTRHLDVVRPLARTAPQSSKADEIRVAQRRPRGHLREQHGRGGTGPISVVIKLAGGLVVDDPVVGIDRRRAEAEGPGGKRAGAGDAVNTERAS